MKNAKEPVTVTDEKCERAYNGIRCEKGKGHVTVTGGENTKEHVTVSGVKMRKSL